MVETVCVTGGNGYIGAWCVIELLRRGYNVRATLRDLAREASVRALIADVVDPGDRLSFHAAELTSTSGWEEAVTGCAYVLHVASPLATTKVKHPDEMIIPAREGVLNVLRASAKAGVKRVVLTSSVAAVGGTGGDEVLDEAHWTNIGARDVHAYRLSKTIAERAAWDFIAADGCGMELTTVLPAVVIGPVLSAEGLGSVQVVHRLLAGKLPGIPRLGFTLVDVRDVADLHVRAMIAPEARGERFIAAEGFKWMAEIGAILRGRLGDDAKRVPTCSLPDFVPRLMAIFDPALRYVVPSLGRRNSWSSAKAQRMLGWKPRPAEDSIVDCARSLIERGAI